MIDDTMPVFDADPSDDLQQRLEAIDKARAQEVAKSKAALEAAAALKVRDQAAIAEQVFTISRTFAASREQMWKAFSDQSRMKQWWTLNGFKVDSSDMDFRAGGYYLYQLQTPDDQDIWGKWSYQQIDFLQQIVMISSFSDEMGQVVRNPDDPTWPLELLNTFTFGEADGQTLVTLSVTPVAPTAGELKTFEDSADQMTRDWLGIFGALATQLANA
jgi:uncharacterized protein YndB with AHSA1/START domain